MTLGTTNH